MPGPTLPRQPFDFGNCSRLRALIRRASRRVSQSGSSSGAGLDTRGHRAWVRSVEAQLTARIRAARALARRAGDIVGRGDIAEHVWDEHYDPLSNVVDVYVKRLRRKLDRPGTESLIRTRRGEGYQLAEVP